MIRIAKTENGMVKGLPAADPRITVFKGIPFAAPPIKENRWRAPQPCQDWEGIRKAYEFAPISMQDTPGLGTDIYCREWHVDPEIPMDEDCLYLNIWTGAKSPEEMLPVLIWYFGGGFQWGYPAEMEFDGERLARRGIIVVSVNYRLGAMGFMAHPELTAAQPDAPTNFGSLDQQAGLKWVVRNIAAFGGDPKQITLAGQSAGGASVLAQMNCPENEGLFQRAVVLSGMIRSPYTEDPFIIPGSLEQAEEKGISFLEFLGVKGIDEARKLDALYIRDKYAEYAQNHPRMGLCVDGHFCPGEPMERFMRGEHIQVPMMAGNTGDEFPDMIVADKPEEYDSRVRELFGEKAEQFLSFPQAQFCAQGGGYAPVSGIECTVKSAFLQEERRGFGGCQYYYRFAPEIPGWDRPGTFHSVDLWFFFETLAKCWRPFTGKHYDLARQMCNYFANFVKTGDPNGPDADGSRMPLWAPYTAENPCEMVFSTNGALPGREKDSPFLHFLMNDLKERLLKEKRAVTGKKQAFNPYLPSWEYIPDGEPYVFGDRVYVYGSHDFYNGYVFCMGDYVCWSAPVDDLASWRYEGVIYEKTQDPFNREGKMCLYAPDVTVGPDGRYYLYYVLDKVSVVSVAVCDTPAGKYSFYGYVHYADGTLLGERAGDEPQFDPGVLTEGDMTYLYTGFCGSGDKSRHGAMVTVLDRDMVTVLQAPQIIVPGSEYSAGTEYEGHAFFEAPSIRKRKDTYYFIYSSQVMHELCYAVSQEPTGGFSYGGVLVSNSDLHIDSYKPADLPTAYGANNHGSIVEIQGQPYIFYHRQTNGTWYSRQGCAEKLTVHEDGSIEQAQLTSCGLNDGPLKGVGYYPAYLACNLFTDTPSVYVGGPTQPRVMQDGRDGDECEGYVGNIQDTATAGFKFFRGNEAKQICIWVRGYVHGVFEVRTEIGGKVLAELKVDSSNIWYRYTAPIALPEGEYALYLTFRGHGNAMLKGFELREENEA